MADKMYKKTYKPLIAWTVGLLIISIMVGYIFENLSLKASVFSVLTTMVIGFYILFLILYRGEYVYWLNGGPSFKEAQDMGSENRKKYAKAYLDKFFQVVLIWFAYGLISFLVNINMWIDTVFVIILTLWATISTAPIKFK